MKAPNCYHNNQVRLSMIYLSFIDDIFCMTRHDPRQSNGRVTLEAESLPWISFPLLVHHHPLPLLLLQLSPKNRDTEIEQQTKKGLWKEKKERVSQ